MNRAFLVGSLAIVLLAGCFRVYHLGQRSLWLDEAIAANISRGTISQTLTLTRGFHSAPVVDPLILYGAEKLGTSPVAVRLPSAVASLAAVVVVLCFAVIPSIGYRTAALSALMLAVSAPQIRYAQEVREYSLSVLYAAILLFAFLAYTSKRPNDKEDSSLLLCVTLLFAPLVQYGLVLFSFGILAALFVLAVAAPHRAHRIIGVIKASCFLALGGIASLFLTLRYQWGDDTWYLEEHYFSRGSNLFHFILYNTHHLVTFLLPGLAAAVLSVIAVLIHLGSSLRERRLPPLALLACTSCGFALICALLHKYPYGGIRQCLFLAPVLCVLASACLVEAGDKLGSRHSSFVFAAIACVVLISGILQIRSVKPYAEVEDIHHVLLSLQSQLQPADNVYIYPGAVPATDFYVKVRDPRFIYGDFHQQAPAKYVSEMMAGLQPGTTRLWLVFSHVYREEDQFILNELAKDWKIEPVRSAVKSSLYLATRPLSVALVPSKPGDDSDPPSLPLAGISFTSDHTHSSFWDWNIRNCGLRCTKFLHASLLEQKANNP